MENISFLLVLGLGFISIISPCILPLLPAYIGYMSSMSIEEINQFKNRKKILKKIITNSALFSLGFSVVFIILGTSASLIGQYFLANKNTIERISGALIILLAFLILFRVGENWRLKTNNGFSQFGLLKPFILGLLFAFSWSPCMGPIIASILVLAANTETIFEGIKLLTAYSLGLSLSFILAGVIFLTGGWKILNKPKIYKIIHYLTFILLFLIGILMISGKFNFIVGQLNLFYNNLGINF